MDNKIFNVNGRTIEQLKLAVQLLLLDEYNKKQKVKGWYFSKKKVLILTWSSDETRVTPFTNRMGQPEEINEDELTDQLWVWLSSDQAKEVEDNEDNRWDYYFNDSDVSMKDGWRLYTEDWGHIKEENGHTIDHYSIAAFKKVSLWYGK